MSQYHFTSWLFMVFAETCCTIQFVHKVNEKALKGHTIATIKSSKVEFCEMRCFLNHDCNHDSRWLNHRSSNLIFCLLNARSLRNKSASFCDYVQDFKTELYRYYRNMVSPEWCCSLQRDHSLWAQIVSLSSYWS